MSLNIAVNDFAVVDDVVAIRPAGIKLQTK